MIHDNTIVATWEMAEYEEQSRSNDWYWIVGCVTLVGIILTIWLKDYIFSFIILLGAGLLITYSIRKPHTVRIEISTEGIKVAHVFYKYEDIKAFWITEQSVASTSNTLPSDDRNPTEEVMLYHILLATTSWYHPFVKIPIARDINPFELREFLLPVVEEAEITEPIGYKISERLGF